MSTYYTLRKSGDLYLLTSNLITSMSYSLKRLNSSCEYIEVLNGVLQGLDTIQLAITRDGEYKIDIVYIDPTTSVNINATEYIQAYPVMIRKIIQDIAYILCGDHCASCSNDCTNEDLKNCIQYQNIFNSLLLYSNLINKFDPYANSAKKTFDLFIQSACEKYRCDISNALEKQIYNYRYLANSEGTAELFKIFVAMYYTGLYLREYNLAFTDVQKNYIKNLFQIDNISICIKNLGLSFDDIVTDYEEQAAILNTAPIVENKDIFLYDLPTTYTFQKSDFLTNYRDAESDLPYKVRILNKSVNGTFKYNGNVVIPGFEFNIDNANLLTYISFEPTNTYDPYDILVFRVSDLRTNPNTSLFSDAAIIYLNVVNVPVIETLNCGTITHIMEGSSLNIPVTIPYTGGNGKVYNSQEILSYEITGLTLTIIEGTLNVGNGSLSGYVRGIPSGLGSAKFDIAFGTQTCTLTTTITENQNPVLGNNTLNLENRVNHLFTVADFTTNTTPPYSDPESEPLESIKIISLNVTEGSLLYNSTAVYVNQIITIADIAIGDLVYMAKNINAATSDSFIWAGKNSGMLDYIL